MSCFGGRDEQIYLVELTIERIKLSTDKYHEEFADCTPLVKLKFIDFPVFVISRRSEDSSSSSALPYDESVGLLYACGKSCLFVRKPRDLVAAMQAQPLKIGLFRAEETYPIAETTIPLSGCLCDQVAMARNDDDHRPKPYQLAGEYRLVDPGKNPAGSINIFLRLTLFGSHIISDYQLYKDNCVFKNDYNGEVRVTKINDDTADENDQSQFKISYDTLLGGLPSNRVASNTEENLT